MNVVTNDLADSQSAREYAFTDGDFRMIAELANAKFGLFLQESKKSLVYSRLARRLRALNLGSFHDYCALLATEKGEAEQPNFLSALTTNVTHFFREQHHFDQLRKDILPELMPKVRAGGSLRIWSSACSSGQEAYCLAATVLDVCPDATRLDIKILATDVDSVVVEKARKGRYPIDQLDAIVPQYRSKMVDDGTANDGLFGMSPKLRELISFAQLNLMDAWPMRRPFDVIMCRNAAIYFDKATQARLWSRFEQALKPGGYLMIGHSERLSGAAAAHFRSIGITAYQKSKTD